VKTDQRRRENTRGGKNFKGGFPKRDVPIYQRDTPRVATKVKDERERFPCGERFKSSPGYWGAQLSHVEGILDSHTPRKGESQSCRRRSKNR